MRTLLVANTVALLSLVGCPAGSTPPPNHPPTSHPSSQPDSQPTSTGPAPVNAASIPPERRVHAYIKGVHRLMDIDEARSYGFTIVDLSDDWVPYIFWSQTPGSDENLPNDYADRFVDLANDRIDLDGGKLASWERNYLEVYGIPPTLSVVRKRFDEDDQRGCFAKLDRSLFAEYHGPVRVADPQGSARLRRRYFSARANYKKALRQARVRSLEQLLKRPAYAKVARTYQQLNWQYKAIDLVQKRLVCEKMFGRRTPRLKPGVIDWNVLNALKRFEKKHNIYGWGMVFQKTGEFLGRSAKENDFESLKRVIAARVIDAVGVLEDGSKTSRYRAADGSWKEVRDEVSLFSQAAWTELGLNDAEQGARWLRGFEPKDYHHLLIALQLPKVPEYYADHMDLSVITNRGDVWYDLPFDEKTGKSKGQPRSRLPSITIYTSYRGQKIALARWRTTIGGWQKEKRGEQEYYKYKISDVGKRVWRHIIAGPVWVPPKTTPTTDLVKFRSVGGSSQRVVAQSAFGPGYASAYGLVAAYHVTKGGRDNQVRTHGTVNYMSVRAGFSHGCHRLHNFRAVRLFSFVLRHRNFVRKGQARLAYHNRFEHRGEEFQINIHTRGYFYELTPPVPIEVLEGTIRGKKKEPYPDYVQKPTQLYQEDLKGLHKGPHKKKQPNSSVGAEQPI